MEHTYLPENNCPMLAEGICPLSIKDSGQPAKTLTMMAEAEKKYAEVVAKNERLEQWVSDLQSGMYINCVYCGHQYGPKDEVPMAMADVLKEHIEQCPEHPMSKVKDENQQLRDTLESISKTPRTFPEMYCAMNRARMILEKYQKGGE